MKNFYLDKKNTDESLFRIKYRIKNNTGDRVDGNFVRKTLERSISKMLWEDHLLPEKGDIIYISGINGFGEEFLFICEQVENVNVDVDFYYDIKSKDVNTGSYSIFLEFEIEIE